MRSASFLILLVSLAGASCDVQYFVSGGAGSVRTGDFRPSAIAGRGCDADLHFMLVEIAGDALHIQAISRSGETVVRNYP